MTAPKATYSLRLIAALRLGAVVDDILSEICELSGGRIERLGSFSSSSTSLGDAERLDFCKHALLFKQVRRLSRNFKWLRRYFLAVSTEVSGAFAEWRFHFPRGTIRYHVGEMDERTPPGNRITVPRWPPGLPELAPTPPGDCGALPARSSAFFPSLSRPAIVNHRLNC